MSSPSTSFKTDASVVEEILRYVGLSGMGRNRGPRASGASSGARGDAAERRLTVDEYALVNPPDEV